MCAWATRQTVPRSCLGKPAAAPVDDGLGDVGALEISSGYRKLQEDIFGRKVLGGIRVDVACGLFALQPGFEVGSAI